MISFESKLVLVWGVTALGFISVGILIYRDWIEKKGTEPNLITNLSYQLLLGGMIWGLANGIPISFAWISADRMCADEDDIACGMLIFFPLLFALFITNLVIFSNIIINIELKNRCKAAGAILPYVGLLLGLGILMFKYPS